MITVEFWGSPSSDRGLSVAETVSHTAETQVVFEMEQYDLSPKCRWPLSDSAWKAGRRGYGTGDLVA